MSYPSYPRESDAAHDAYDRVDIAIYDILALAGLREPRRPSLTERLGRIRDKDPFLNQNPGP